MSPNKRFQQQKEVALRKLEKDRKEKKVDRAMLSLVTFINSLKNYYTTSSCAGRIAILHDVGSKRDNDFLGKWHREVKFKEVQEALKDLPKKGLIWFKFEPAILHIGAKKFENARKLLILSLSSGYKRSGIHGLKEGRFLIEICDTDKIDAPIGEQGKLLISESYLRYLAKSANKKFQRGQKKLKKFEEILRQNLK